MAQKRINFRRNTIARAKAAAKKHRAANKKMSGSQFETQFEVDTTGRGRLDQGMRVNCFAAATLFR
jgi:hypothetical protein